MKRLIIAVVVLVLAGVIGYCAAPHSIGNVTVSRIAFSPKTRAQMNLLTPDTTGQVIFCSDCGYSALCISSGADSGRIGAWLSISTNTTSNHCN